MTSGASDFGLSLYQLQVFRKKLVPGVPSVPDKSSIRKLLTWSSHVPYPAKHKRNDRPPSTPNGVDCFLLLLRSPVPFLARHTPPPRNHNAPPPLCRPLITSRKCRHP